MRLWNEPGDVMRDDILHSESLLLFLSPHIIFSLGGKKPNCLLLLPSHVMMAFQGFLWVFMRDGWVDLCCRVSAYLSGQIEAPANSFVNPVNGGATVLPSHLEV